MHKTETEKLSEAMIQTTTDIKPTRPVLRYHGGKWMLARKIIAMIPEHRIYCEPYGGAASILMRKPRAFSEVYNDLDSEVVNVFRVMQKPESKDRLKRLLEVTPYARDEFLLAYEPDPDPVEQARRTIIKSFMGFSSNAIHKRNGSCGMLTRSSTWKAPTGFRSNSSRSGTTPAHDWMHYPTHLDSFCVRLRGVVIENRDALEVMACHDKPDAFHFVDPPYVKSTRSDVGDDYWHEIDDEQHRALAEFLHTLKGAAMVSGYRSELYDELYVGWERIDWKHMADGARDRTESLWISPNCRIPQQTLLEECDDGLAVVSVELKP